MTLEEKLAYIGGDRDFYIRAVPRLGIPEIKLSDGPSGCRNWGPSTAYPAAIALAASFDDALAEHVGKAIGRDCRARGVHILLAPGVNLQRSPLNGRNFEYMGEDPLLAGKTAAAYVRGVQGEGVLATVKHFAANNQEWDRNHVSSEVDERTLRELYLPAFEITLREGGAQAVMTAYNLLNGTYCSHHEWLLRDLLKRDWGFRGFVMSDWAAVHDALPAAEGGCDLEMPSGKHMNLANLGPLLESGRLDAKVIDDKVRRILRTLAAAGFLDRPQKRDDVPLDDPSSREIAREAARKSVVLLKNDGALLPLAADSLREVAVIGPNAHPAVWGGSGSAFVTPLHTVSLLEGLREVAPQVTFVHHPGVRQPSDAVGLGSACFSGPVRQEIFAGRNLEGPPRAVSEVDRIHHVPGGDYVPAPGLGSEHYSIRWTGRVTAAKAGRYRVVSHSDDGMRVFVGGRLVIDDWNDHAPTTHTATVTLGAGEHEVVVEYYQGILGAVAQFGFGPERKKGGFEGAAEVSALAKRADVVLVSVGFGQSEDTNSAATGFAPFWPPAWAREAGLVEAEDSDRPFALPAAQLETLRIVLAANPKTAVLVTAGGGIDPSPWLPRSKALLWTWYPGQEGGRALAELLFGQANPGGKLPITLARRYDDHPSAPFYQLNQEGKTPYSEGLFMGYRGFDARRTEPLFPFGFGLSYTTFAYAGLATKVLPDGSVEIAFDVKNTGGRTGDEVAQVYAAFPPGSLPRPPRELKAYRRVTLSPGETQRVRVVLPADTLRTFDPAARRWQPATGRYGIFVGSSSRDLPLEGSADLQGAATPSTPAP
jgi:beta-glucosidase